MSSPEKYTYIDSARGLAILMVILVHATQAVAGLPRYVAAVGYFGQLGVQLFFVASAFTMCNSFQSRSSEPCPVVAFYVRRFFRIAPLYYVGILYYSIIRHFVLPFAADRWLYTPLTIALNFVFMHGFYPPAQNGVVPGGWSIGVEMVFYVMFPVLYRWICLCERPVRRALYAFFVVLIGNIILQIGVSVMCPGLVGVNRFMYYCIGNQLPVFLVGIICYVQSRQRRSVSGSSMSFPAQLATIGVLSGLSLSLIYSRYIVASALLPGISAIAFYFVLGFMKATEGRWTILASIGRVSYSMYIFHFTFAWYVAPRLQSHYLFYSHPVVKLIMCFVLSVIASFALALATEKWIEKAGIELGSRIVARVQNATSHATNT